MAKPYLIGITGGSGSGKTFFLGEIIKKVGKENVLVVSQDNYYRGIEHQPLDSNGIENFDTPESINNVLFAQHINSLRNGETVRLEEYTFNNPDKEPKLLTFSPRPIIVIEGIFVFHFQEVANLLDLRIYIDAKPELKLKRRILRDNVERGYSLDDVLYRYEYHVMPAYERFIKKYKHQADMTIYNNKGFDKVLEILAVFFKVKIAD